MGVLEIIHAERRSCREQQRVLVHIRVTTDAFPKVVTATPITPERARTLGKLWALPDGTVDAAYDGRGLEILVHPEDWADLLKDTEAIPYVQMPMRDGEPERVMGIPVSHG